MSAKGITIAEECHVINGLGAVDIGGVAKLTDVWSMENYSHATIIVTCGSAGGAGPTITVFEATDSTAGTETAIGYSYYLEATAAGDTLATRVAVANTGISMGAADTTTLVIEVDASELSAGYPWMRVKTSAAAACLTSIVVVLSGSRYAGDPSKESPTAII